MITGGWSLTLDTVAVQPVLSIALDGTQAVISWPVSAAGFTLEYAAMGASPAVWQTVPEIPVLVNGRYEVRRSLPGIGEMYRLRQ